MLVKDQIAALKRHEVRISVSLPDGISSHLSPEGNIFLCTWVVEDDVRSSYDPGEITICIGDHCYSRLGNEEWDEVPSTLKKAFAASDLSDILCADTSEWGDDLFMAVYGLDTNKVGIYRLDWDDCPYNTEVCNEPKLTPKFDFIEVL